MIFITHIKNAKAAKDYYSQHLGPGDYYGHDAAEMSGIWHGMGAELLGLKGDVTQADYFKLCDNINPMSGEQLTPETKGNRRVLRDFTFDAPKSVSLALEVGGDENVLLAFQESVRETMAEIERQAMTRVRKGGADHDRATSNMVWSEHIHRTARPVDGSVDLQLHCHATVINATYDSTEDRWKAIQLGDIVRDKGYYQAAFHSRLAGKLVALGYGIERDGKSFKLAGIDRATVEKFSRRTAVIEEKAKALGISDAGAKSKLGRKTREKKDALPKTMNELRRDWDSRLTDEERWAIKGASRDLETTTLSAQQGMDHAILHSFERESVVTERKLLTNALIHSVGNASVEDVRAQLIRGEIIRKSKAGQAFVTTTAVRREEMNMTAWAREGRGKFKRLGGVVVDSELGHEATKAANKILTSRDRVTVLRGKAGAGKTTLLKTTVRAIERSGKKVLAYAPSSSASRDVLVSEGFKDATTVESLLMDEKRQKQIAGQVILIDEAGLLSTPDMSRVFELAQRQNARILLSGDTGQHHAVGRGDALRILEEDAGLRIAELKTVRRQTNEKYREAITAISSGDTPGAKGKTRFAEGIDLLDRMGAIKEIDGDERYGQIAVDYVTLTTEKKKNGVHKTALVVSPTHAEADKVTERIREALKVTGIISGPDSSYYSIRSLGLTQAERGDFGNYEPGLVVRWNQHAKNFRRGERVIVTGMHYDRLDVVKADGKASALLLKDAKHFDVFRPAEISLAKGDKVRITVNGFTRETRRGVKNVQSRLNNGDIFEVKKLREDGDIEMTNGFVVPQNYGGIANGFVITSHASQGKTTDYALVALGQQSFAAANREQLYVSLSRGREGVKLYTDDKAQMLEAVRTSSARMSVSELFGDQEPVKKRSVMSRLMTMQTVRRAYQAVRERMTWIPPQQEVRHGIRL